VSLPERIPASFCATCYPRLRRGALPTVFSQHASLYTKDKMFSAINWKGKNKDLLAIVVIDGPWTAETLRGLAKVYDYVAPLNNVSNVAKVIYDYLQGDRSKLRWLIDFSINPASSSSGDLPQEKKKHPTVKNRYSS